MFAASNQMSQQLSMGAVKEMIYPNAPSTTSTINTSMNSSSTTSIISKNNLQISTNMIVMIQNVQQAHSSAITKNFLPCQVSDQEFTIDAVLYCMSMTEAEKLLRCKSCIVRVNGYITSEGNLHSLKKPSGNPSRDGGFNSGSILLCITAFQILHLEEHGHGLVARARHFSMQPKEIKVPAQSGKIPGGQSATILQQTCACFTDEELAGIPSNLQVPSQTQGHACMRNGIQKIQAFLTNHQAMNTLSINGRIRNQYTDANNATPSIGGSHLTGNYSKAIEEFREAQIKRQIASLTNNASGESSDNATKMVTQYSSAMFTAMSHAESNQCLTIEDVCKWHGILGDGIITNAGQLRTKMVRAGLTTFTDKDCLREELEKYVFLLRELEVTLLHNRNSSMWGDDGANIKKGYGPLLLASVATFVLCDIHAFHDGNGRLSRILGNWALRRAGFPFVVNLFATPLQRAEYINSIMLTRRNVGIIGIGSVSPDVFSTVRRMVGILKPLVELYVDRTQKATTQCLTIISEKSRIKSEEMEAKAAKRFREAAAAGCCLICMDDDPNIATLCCGKAVHINCMATWLSNRLECPHCRNVLPSLPQREPAPPDHSDQISTSHSIDSDGDTYDSPADETVSAQEDATMNAGNAFETTDTTDSLDGVDPFSTNDSLGSDTTDTMTEEQVTTQPRTVPQICTFQACGNRAAIGCSCSACGRCCQLYGQYNCDRHNT
jgi:fido (protein-threonine AMPylation protein)